MKPPEIFDRNARRLRRGRTHGGGFFLETMADDLLDRLDGVQRTFTAALVVGAEPVLMAGLTRRGISFVASDASPRRADRPFIGDEDQPLFDDGVFDLVLSSGALDTVSDLPGALVRLRRAMRPDGLLLANFTGAPSLTTFRDIIAKADAEHGLAVARLHPQIDVRAAGDLLVRAGFALSVADLDTLDIAYSGLPRLIDDLRAAAATNVLAQRHPLTRRWLASAIRMFDEMAREDGKTHETLSYITLTGWSPGPDQPQPARRGSGIASLTEALRPER